MLELNKLSIKTREPILTDFSYSFNSNSIYGLVATNGSGKTTFFRVLAGLIPKMSGEIKKTNKIFYFESIDWFDKNLSGLDYLNFTKKDWNSEQNIRDIIHYWKMESYIKLPIKKYSLGMKQRLIIALYQVSGASILLMDEITNGLDESSRKDLFSLLSLFADEGKLVILSSHYKEDIIMRCDYLISFENQKMKVETL